SAARADRAALAGVLGARSLRRIAADTPRLLTPAFAHHHRHLRPLATNPDGDSGLAHDRAGTARGGAPRCPREAASATPHRGPPARYPRAPEACRLAPDGRIQDPHPFSFWPDWSPNRSRVRVLGVRGTGGGGRVGGKFARRVKRRSL